MKTRSIRRGILCVGALLGLTCPVGYAQMHPAPSAPTTRPAVKTFIGTILSITLDTGEVKLAWKHPRRAQPMDFFGRLDDHVQIIIDGQPGKPADLKPGDHVSFTGQVKPVGGKKPFVIELMEVRRKPTSRPAESRPAADDVLERLEQQSRQVRDLVAKITVTRNDPAHPGAQVYQGVLRFKDAKPSPRVLIRLDPPASVAAGQGNSDWYVFDGQWFHEARAQAKTLVKRQLVRPNEPAELFRLGQDPFPLPFALKRTEIARFFQVRQMPARPNDPPHAVHLECTPRADTDLEKRYQQIDLYMDLQLGVPLRIRVTEKAKDVAVTVDLPADTMEINRDLPASALELPELKGYAVETVPLGNPGMR